MKIKLQSLFIGLALLAGVHTTAAQESQFFRISGPTASKITALRSDGSLVWSNSLAGTNYTVQTATSLAEGNNWVDYVKIPVTSKINTNQIFAVNPPAGMALIPAGVFTIGDTLDAQGDAIPTATVSVSAFYIDVNLVSSNQWAAVYAYATNHGYAFVHAGLEKSANHPVETVDWYDCVKWCNARSQQAGLTPAYYMDTGFTQVYTNGEIAITNANVKWSANGYRLPTEAEWEKAARGGLSGQRFPWGNTISESQANYDGSTFSYAYDLGPNGLNPIGSIGGTSPATSPVGSFPANGYGLHDMAGNVAEWCWDFYTGPAYPAGSPYLGGTDPHGPDDAALFFRALRGGYWLNDAFAARSACRESVSPTAAVNSIGLRCVKGF